MLNKDPIKHLTLFYSTYKDNNFSIENKRIDKFIVLKSIGKGSFAKVYKAIDCQRRNFVALKVLDKKFIKYSPQQNLLRRYIQTQGQLMKICKSTNVLKCYDIYQNQDLKILSLEYCQDGTLQNQIKLKNGLSQDQAIIILKQIIFGISELHSNKIIHRDLKPENILIHQGIYKISDLGLSRIIEDINQKKNYTICGSRETMAPEVRANKPYNLKADIWSIGIIFYLMLYSGNNKNYINIKERIINQDFNFQLRNGKYPSKQVQDFLKKVLIIEPQSRLSWETMLNHPIFIRKNDELQNIFKKNPSLKALKVQQMAVEIQIQEQQRINQLQKIIETSKMFEKSYNSEINEEQQDSIEDLSRYIYQNQKKQNQIKLNLRKYQLDCQIVKFNLQQIIEPIEQYQLLDLKSSKTSIRIIYLIINRCFINISRWKHILMKYESSSNMDRIRQFLKAIKPLSNKVQNKFKQYSQKLAKIESKIDQQIVYKILEIVQTQDFLMKKRFFQGLQAIDYHQSQQIAYTQQYIAKKIQSIRNCQKGKEVTKKLNRYRQINNLIVQDLNKKNLTFQQIVQRLL